MGCGRAAAKRKKRGEGDSQMRRRTRRIQVRIDHLILYRVPQMVREARPEPDHQPIKRLERRRVPDIERPIPHRPWADRVPERYGPAGREAVFGASGDDHAHAGAHDEGLDEGDEDRGFDVEHEAVCFVRWVRVDRGGVVRPLAFGEWHVDLGWVVLAYCANMQEGEGGGREENVRLARIGPRASA